MHVREPVAARPRPAYGDDRAGAGGRLDPVLLLVQS